MSQCADDMDRDPHAAGQDVENEVNAVVERWLHGNDLGRRRGLLYHDDLLNRHRRRRIVRRLRILLHMARLPLLRRLRMLLRVGSVGPPLLARRLRIRRLPPLIVMSHGFLYRPLTRISGSGGARPCSKCGQPKTRRSGGGKMRCGPCTDRRVADWKTSRV